jgi:hypothetical protein
VVFSGGIGSVPATANDAWLFAGPTATVSVTAETQKLTGAAMGSIGTSGAARFVDIGLCYDAIVGGVPSGNVMGFAGGDYITDQVSNVQGRITRAAAGSVTGLAPGDYVVGFCLTNRPNPNDPATQTPLDNNDNVNGWVMLTN